MSADIVALQDWLNKQVTGPLTVTEELTTLLSRCWEEFEGHDEKGMKAAKLHAVQGEPRMENAQWNPPTLSFTIERHGAVCVGGSKKADLQLWEVNLEMLQADVSTTGYRYVQPPSPRLATKPIAKELARRIVAGTRDNRLKIHEAGIVQVLIRKIIPDGVPKKTVEGRRRRLRNQLRGLLSSQNWEEIRSWHFRKTTSHLDQTPTTV